MIDLSIRTRATLYLSGLVSLLLVSFALILNAVVSASLERDFRLRMQQEADLLTELFKEELRLKALQEFREEAAELGLNLRVMDAQGQVIFQSRMWGQTLASADIPSPPEGLSELWSTVGVGRMPHTVVSRHVEIDPYPAFIMQVAQPKASVVDAQRKIKQWSLGLIPLMIFLSVLAGYFFAGKLLAPVHLLRKRAEAVNPQDLSARIPYPKTRDELYFLTETLNRALGRIEEAFAKLKAFAADASHELRIPLTAMRGTLELALRRKRTPQAYRTALQEALEEAEHLSRITSDLLALTRADAGEQTLRRVRVAFKPFLEKWAKTFQAAHPDAKIRLQNVAETDVLMDAEQIERVLLNLVDNALKYAGPELPVKISAEVSGRLLHIYVTDRGPGIALEHRERIFDRFYRVGKAPQQAHKSGSGLGLSIASSILRAHGGSLQIHVTSSKGTTFEILLPLD